MQKKKVLIAGSLSIWLAGTVCGAEIPADRYAFPLKWNDTLTGVATDVSFLNHKPAGAKGRVVAEGGHFYTTSPRERIRFLGIGIGGDALFFLSPEEMDQVALRLAKAGVNVVRFHGFDGTHQPYSLIDLSAGKSSAVKADHLDRMFRMIAALKKQGIYSVIGALRMVRQLKPGDGVPAVKSSRECRYADRFDRTFLESQKEWARKLLNTVNPRTGMTLAEDPALLAVEINNESSMLYENKLRWFTDLHPFYQKELQTAWNEFLREKYGSDDARLRNAWGADASAAGAAPAGRWRSAARTIRILPGEKSPAGLVCEIAGAPVTAWSRQLKLEKLPLQDRAAYTLKCRLTHSSGGRIGIALQQSNAPFHSCGLDRTLELPAGKPVDVELGFQTERCSGGNPPVLNLNLGQCPGTLKIEQFQLLPGERSGLTADQSLKRGNLPLPFASTTGKDADWREFLTRQECRYTGEMRRFLRQELNVRAAITDTQINWPGLTSVESQRDMDYVDVHSYWGHPRFLGKAKAWDFVPGNWEIVPGGSAIPSLAKRGWNPMEEASRYRFRDKPLVVSETDYPYPHLFAAEMMPLFATIFCRQDWDALHLFIHGRVPGNRGTEGINHMFDQTNHPAKIGFFPAAALIYRTGLIPPATRAAELRLPRNVWKQIHSYENAWIKADYPRDPLRVRTMIVPDALPEGAAPAVVESGAAEPEPPVRAVVRDGKYLFTADAPGCGIAAGILGGERVELGSLKVALDPFGRGAAANFASVVAVARDGKPLRKSGSILITIGSEFLNHDVEMNAAGNTIAALRTPGARWWGTPPVTGVRLRGWVAVPCPPELRAWRLDSCGRRLEERKTLRDGAFTRISISPEDETIFYELAVR